MIVDPSGVVVRISVEAPVLAPDGVGCGAAPSVRIE
jgi:hypothetical protein